MEPRDDFQLEVEKHLLHFGVKFNLPPSLRTFSIILVPAGCELLTIAFLDQATGLGQVHNPSPEGLRIFIRAMRENGISDGEISMMVNENPGKMLDI